MNHETAVSNAKDIADRILALHAGRRIAFGKPETVRSDPKVVDAYLGGTSGAA